MLGVVAAWEKKRMTSTVARSDEGIAPISLARRNDEQDYAGVFEDRTKEFDRLPDCHATWAIKDRNQLARLRYMQSLKRKATQ